MSKVAAIYSLFPSRRCWRHATLTIHRLPIVRRFRLMCFAVVLAVAAVTTGCQSIADSFSGRKEACEVLDIGEPASATVMRLIDTGTTINDDPVVEFVLLVVPADGEAYEAHSKALVSRLDVPAIQPGRVLPVKFDPQQPARVAIDLWDCTKG